jgi:hypothetical protein
MKVFFSLLAIYLVVFLACVHQPFIRKAQLKGNSCDTVRVTYNGNIHALLHDHCYSCHASAVTANGGLDLENFTSLKGYLALGFRGDGLYGSKFYHCLLHSQNALPMPPNYKLDSCSLTQVRLWIAAGGPDN